MRFLILLLFLTVLEFSHAQEKTLVLQLDRSTARHDWATRASFQYNKGQLFYLNKVSNEIKVFDIGSGETVSSIALHRQGPDRVGPEPSVMKLISSDSILVFSDFFNGQLSLIDSNGKVLRRFQSEDVDNAGQDFSGIVPMGSVGNAISNGEAYVSKMIFNRKQAKTMAPFCAIDLESTRVLSFDKPKLYAGSKLDHLFLFNQIVEPSIVSNQANGTLVVSYPLDHNLYLTDDNFKTVKQVEARSKYFERFHLLGVTYDEIPAEKYRENAREISLLSGRYDQLIFNPYLKLYHRIIKLPVDEKQYSDYKKGLVGRLKSPEYTVMTLDASLNLISEKKMSLNDHRPDLGLFTSPDGLWFLKTEDHNEDEMIFELIDID